MKNNNLINEEVDRIRELMFGSKLISEGFFGSLTREIFSDAITKLMQKEFRGVIKAELAGIVDNYGKEVLSKNLKEYASNPKMFKMNKEAMTGFKDAIVKKLTKGKVDDFAKLDMADKLRITKELDAAFEAGGEFDKFFKTESKNLAKEFDVEIDDVVKGAVKSSDDAAKVVTKDVEKSIEKTADAVKKDLPAEYIPKIDMSQFKVPKNMTYGKALWERVKRYYAGLTLKQKITAISLGGLGVWTLASMLSDETEIPECISSKITDKDISVSEKNGYAEDGLVLIQKTGNKKIDNDGGALIDVDSQTISTVNGNYKDGSYEIKDNNEIRINFLGDIISLSCSSIEGGGGAEQEGMANEEDECPENVEEFQDWLNTNVQGWHKSYPEGLPKDPKLGYGSCGPNTKRAWAKYKNDFLKKEPALQTATIKDIKTLIGSNDLSDELSFSEISNIRDILYKSIDLSKR